MDVVLWIVQAILAIKCLSAAVTHGLQPGKASMAQAMQRLGRAGRPLAAAAGAQMLLAAIGLILPGILGAPAWLTPLAAAGLAVMLLVSIGLHLKSRDDPKVFVSVVLFVLAAAVAYGRWVVTPL